MDVRNESQTAVNETMENASLQETQTGAENENSGKKKGFPVFRVILVLLILVIAALAVFRIVGTEKKIETNPLSTVSVGHAEKGEITIETSLIGTVMPGDVYYVIPKVSGEIKNIYVAVGDSVKAGDPICEIDNSKAIDAAKISLDGAQVQVKTAEEAVALATTNLNRMQALLAAGDISQQTYESTKNGYDQATAGLEGARLQLEGAQLQYDTQVEFATVTAPVDGVVQSTAMSLNGLVSSASQVCVISSSGENKLTFNITDRLVDELQPGSPVRVTKQGSEYSAKVVSVASLPNAATGLYPVEAAFDESNAIANGSSVKVSFVSEKADNVVLMDTDDIHYDGGKTYVYTLSYNDTADLENADPTSTISENNRLGTVHKAEVEIGISNSEKTEIISGLDTDALLITSWTSQLYEGALVQVLPEG